MKKVISILLISFILASCTKIQPENTQKKDTWSIQPKEIVNKKETFDCGIISCNQKDYLLVLKDWGNLVLPNLEYYQKRFWVLIERYKTYNALVSSQDYQKFVEDINIDFFNCSWDFRYCEKTQKKYGENEMNYLFYIFLPQMVIEEYEKRWIHDMIMIEDVIQSIKRKDYTIWEIKSSVIDDYSQKLEKKYKNYSFWDIDTQKLKTDNEYFKQIILWNGDGIFYQILNETQEVNLNWISEEQMELILEETFNVFFKQIETLWLTKKDFYDKLPKEKIESELKEKVNAFVKKYNLTSKLPNDRFLRNDELYLFNKNNISKFEKSTFWNKDFLPEVKDIRDTSYLLYVLWEEENLFFFPNLVKKLQFENNFVFLNLFDYAKQIKYNTQGY